MRASESHDSQLIEDALKGSQRAWKRLCDRHASLIWSVARGCGLNQADAEDVAQTVFIALVRRLPHLEDPSSLTGWLVTSAKRASWRVAARKRRQGPMGHATSELEEATDDLPIEARERQQAVRTALKHLDQRCRDLLITLFGAAGEPSYTQVAERLDVAPNSVGPTRRRCLDKLLAELQKADSDLFD